MTAAVGLTDSITDEEKMDVLTSLTSVEDTFGITEGIVGKTIRLLRLHISLWQQQK